MWEKAEFPRRYEMKISQLASLLITGRVLSSRADIVSLDFQNMFFWENLLRENKSVDAPLDEH